MCLAGIKMAEQAALHYTADASLRLPIAQALTAEAQRLIQILLQLLDVGSVKQRAGPVVIAAVKAVGLCCLQRPALLPALLPPLLDSAQQVCLCDGGLVRGCFSAAKHSAFALALADLLVCMVVLRSLHAWVAMHAATTSTLPTDSFAGASATALDQHWGSAYLLVVEVVCGWHNRISTNCGKVHIACKTPIACTVSGYC